MFVESRDQLDSISKAGLKVKYADNGNPIIFMNNSFWLECEKDDTAFTPCALDTGNWEAWNAVAMMRELGTRPAPTFMDVGANVGYYTLMSLTEGYKTFSFEPNGTVMGLLLNSVRTHNDTEMSKQNIQQMGVGERQGALFLHHFDGHSGADSFTYGPDEGKEVSVTTLDKMSMFYDDTGEFVIKVDVEGFEREVWNGAKNLREKSNNVWFVEWVPVRHGYDYNKAWLEEVLLTHDIQMVNYDGTLRPMGIEECLTATFETIVFRSR